MSSKVFHQLHACLFEFNPCHSLPHLTYSSPTVFLYVSPIFQTLYGLRALKMPRCALSNMISMSHMWLLSSWNAATPNESASIEYIQDFKNSIKKTENILLIVYNVYEMIIFEHIGLNILLKLITLFLTLYDVAYRKFIWLRLIACIVFLLPNWLHGWLLVL